MRYPLKVIDVLSWLLKRDADPKVLPEFSDDRRKGLVAAHLIAGRIVAEVVLSPEHLLVVSGPGLPLGRLYFQISKSELYKHCPGLPQDELGGAH